MALGGLEILVICSIIGGVIGYLLRKNVGKNATAFAILIGIAGSCVMTWLLVTILFSSYLLMPAYGMFGAWLAVFLVKKLR